VRSFPVDPDLGELVWTNADNQWHTTDFYLNHPEHKRRRCSSPHCQNRCIVIRAWSHTTRGWCGSHVPDSFTELLAVHLDDYVARWWYEHCLDIVPLHVPQNCGINTTVGTSGQR
jgi:hypothetical protein